MKFNPFHYVEPGIDDMKNLLFPFRFKKWLKLGLISLLSANAGSGGGGSPNFNIPSTPLRNGGTPEPTGNFTNITNEITGKATKGAKESLGALYYLIIPFIILFIVLMLVMSWITSVFSFIFLEALVTGKVQIRKAWRRQKPLGWSFFLFRIVIGLIILAVMGLFSLPFVVPMVMQGATAYFENFALISLAWMIPFLLLFMIVMILFGVFYSLVFHFSLVHMYFTKRGIRQSIKDTFKRINKNKLEVFIFLLARIVINIVTGLAGILVLLALLVPFLIIAIPIGIMVYAIGSAIGWGVISITIAVIVGIALILFLIYVLMVILLPITTFARYFSIRNYKVLMKK
ncbi:hypothetical protein KY349_04515 [Candidatus Woesearchaeota archaeon]|nr:hypothetical protein [Candidatus Woesearchaeota archaeon]